MVFSSLTFLFCFLPLLYLLLFLVHNFLLAPLLVHGHRRVAYFSSVVAVLIVFSVCMVSRFYKSPPHAVCDGLIGCLSCDCIVSVTVELRIVVGVLAVWSIECQLSE